MARFILDIGNLSKEEIAKALTSVLEGNFVGSRISTITCIDESNENQFHEEGELNVLTSKQIESYNEGLIPYPSVKTIKNEGKLVTDYETQEFEDTEMYLVEMYAYKGYMYTIALGKISRRSKTA